MRLLLISNEYPPIGGGGSILVKYLARDLVKLDNEVMLITSSYDKLPKKEVVDGYQIIRVPAIRLRKDYCSTWELAIFSVSALVYTFYYCLKFKPDLIQAYFAVPAGGIAWVVNKLLGIPYAVYLGGSDVPGANPYRYKNVYPILGPFIKLFWRSASFVTAASRGLAKTARESDPTQKFIVIENGVDTQRFAFRRKFNKKVLTILGIGRLMPRKGYQFVIEALPEVLKNTNQKFEFICVGGGDYMEDLKAMAKKYKVLKYIKFVGQLSYDEIYELYKESDIFVHPSLAEGMPLALLEAVASGLPSITTRIAGNEDLVENNVNGFLIEPEDVEGISASLIKLLNSESLRKRYSLGSVKLAQRFDWKIISKKYNQIYKKLNEKGKNK